MCKKKDKGMGHSNDPLWRKKSDYCDGPLLYELDCPECGHKTLARKDVGAYTNRMYPSSGLDYIPYGYFPSPTWASDHCDVFYCYGCGKSYRVTEEQVKRVVPVTIDTSVGPKP